MRLNWLGHATVVIDLDGERIVTDPILRRHAGFLRRPEPGPTPDTWEGAAVALVSHTHLDHADLPSLRRLAVPTFASSPIATWLAGKSVAGRALEEGRDWAPLRPGSKVQIRLVRAEHHSRPLPHRPSPAHGFLLRGPSGVVWFPGDTDTFEGIEEIREQAGGTIDVALLPIHGWGPRLGDGHLNALSAAGLAAQLGIGAVQPIHYGTFHPLGFNLRSLDWMTAPLEEFTDELARVAPAIDLLPPQVDL